MLLLLFPAGTRAESADPETVRVRVSLSVGSINRLTAAVEGQYRCGDTTFVGGTLTITARDGIVRAVHSDLGELARGDSVRIVREEETVWAAFLTLPNVRYGDCRYLGDMIFSTDGEDRLRVVNDVDMRAYLYGVVGGELRNTHPTEALKAQAVAAKCFALTCLDVSKPYDVDDTPTDQVYKGYHPAHEHVIAAVNAVADDVLLYAGDVVRCYYCTSNGGQTITPLMRWGNNSDQNAVFSMEYDIYDLEGADDAVLLHILPDVHALPDAAAMFFLRLAKEQNASVTQVDTILSLHGLHDPLDPDGSHDAPSDLAPQTHIEAQLACRTADGAWITVNCGFSPERLQQENLLFAPDANTVYLRPEDDGSWTLIFARAVGHRVGMSHEGMLARAEAGFTYDEILLWYYPGAELVSRAAMSEDEAIPATETPTVTAAPQPTATPEPVLIPCETEPTLWERWFGTDQSNS